MEELEHYNENDFDIFLDSDISMEGTIQNGKRVLIKGQFKGIIKAEDICVIDQMAVFTGSIISKNCYIKGKVVGDIKAHFISVSEQAVVEGDLIYQQISIDINALVNGNLKYEK